MQVSSEVQLPATPVPSLIAADPRRYVEPCNFKDEEFPADLPGNYDWMLQPASQVRAGRRIRLIVLLSAVLLVATSIFLVHKLSVPSPAVLATPTSSLP